jgi:hypothetical protein
LVSDASGVLVAQGAAVEPGVVMVGAGRPGAGQVSRRGRGAVDELVTHQLNIANGSRHAGPRSRSSPAPVRCSRAPRRTLRRHGARWDAVVASGDAWLSAREALDAWHDDRALLPTRATPTSMRTFTRATRPGLALGKGTTAESESRDQLCAAVGFGAGRWRCAGSSIIVDARSKCVRFQRKRRPKR